MFVMTAKISKPKLIGIGIAIVAIILLIIVLASSGGTKDATNPNTPAGATNDERVAFLATYGWSVNAKPKESQSVKIPETAESKVFVRYNALQQSQGFDLTRHSGKEVMRYVYEILNYPEASSPVYASLLVCDGHIIGGDITSTAPDGVIHGFAFPSAPGNNESLIEPTQAKEETQGSEPTQSVDVSQTDSSEPTEASDS